MQFISVANKFTIILHIKHDSDSEVFYSEMQRTFLSVGATVRWLSLHLMWSYAQDVMKNCELMISVKASHSNYSTLREGG